MSFPSYRAVSKIGFCHITFCESTDLEKSNMFGKKNSLLSLVNKRQVQRGVSSSSGGCASMTFGRKHVF